MDATCSDRQLLVADIDVDTAGVTVGQTPNRLGVPSRWWAVGIITTLLMAGSAHVWSGSSSQLMSKGVSESIGLAALASVPALLSRRLGKCSGTFACSEVHAVDEERCVSCKRSLPQTMVVNGTVMEQVCRYGWNVLQGTCTTDCHGTKMEPCRCVAQNEASEQNKVLGPFLLGGGAMFVCAPSVVSVFAWVFFREQLTSNKLKTGGAVCFLSIIVCIGFLLIGLGLNALINADSAFAVPMCTGPANER